MIQQCLQGVFGVVLHDVGDVIHDVVHVVLAIAARLW